LLIDIIVAYNLSCPPDIFYIYSDNFAGDPLYPLAS